MLKQLGLLLICLILNSFSSYAQDLILLKDGDSLKVSIINVGESSVKYKKINNPTGPNYVITNDEIESILFVSGQVLTNENDQLVSPNSKNVAVTNTAGGTSEASSGISSKDRRKEKSIYYNQRRNIISYNYASMIYVSMEFGYERILDKTGYFGLKIPIAFNLGINVNYIDIMEIFTTGFHANIYPFGQGRVAYFTGPVLRYSIYEESNQSTSNGNLSISIDPYKSSYLGFYMNNGVLFRPSPFLSFGVSMGFGVRRFLQTSTYSQFHIIGEGSISFRF